MTDNTLFDIQEKAEKVGSEGKFKKLPPMHMNTITLITMVPEMTQEDLFEIKPTKTYLSILGMTSGATVRDTLHHMMQAKGHLVCLQDLLEKKDSYFWTSSVETLEVLESKINQILKNIDCVPKNQPTMAAALNVIRREYIIPVEVDKDTEVRKRKLRFLKNIDPVWSKRLKLTYSMKQKKRTGNFRRTSNTRKAGIRHRNENATRRKRRGLGCRKSNIGVF